MSGFWASSGNGRCGKTPVVESGCLCRAERSKPTRLNNARAEACVSCVKPGCLLVRISIGPKNTWCEFRMRPSANAMRTSAELDLAVRRRDQQYNCA